MVETKVLNPLYDQFQEFGRDWLSSHEYGILADDRGLGKTRQTLLACGKVQAKRVLCIVTKPFVWKDEINWIYPHAEICLPEWSNVWDRQAELKKSQDANFTILTYGIVADHLDTLWKIGYDVIIFDEFHKCCNRSSARHKAAAKLVNWCRQKKDCYRWALTGDPIINHAEDLWSLLHILDHKVWKSYWTWAQTWLQTFQQRISSTRSFTNVGGPKNPEAFKEYHSQWILRREKDILGLPGTVYDYIDCDMTVDQSRMYSQMRDRLYVELEGEELAAINPLVKLQRLNQVAASPALLFPDKIPGLPGGKISEIEEIVEDSGDQAILLFSVYRLPVDRLKAKFKDQAVSYLEDPGDGSTVKQFQTDEKKKIFLTTYASGAEALTLTRGSIVIPYDIPWTAKDAGQAVDRANRIGQTRIVNIQTPMLRNTLDSWRLSIVKSKKQLFEDSIPTERILEALANKEI